VAVTKKDVGKGELLDGIGEYCYRGSIQCRGEARAADALPLGLAKGCITRREIPAETMITRDMVEPLAGSLLSALWEGQA
jgi:predicted homoserine dehydrogenase-like protein